MTRPRSSRRRAAPAARPPADSRQLERAAPRDGEHEAFLAGLIHDLRNPLNVLSMWTHLLTERRLDAEGVARAHANLRQYVDAQSQILADVAELLLLGEPDFELERQPIELAELLGGAIEDMRREADAKALHIASGPAPRRGRLVADPLHLAHAVRGMLRHAIEASPVSGRIDVTSRVRDGRVELAVADSGEGFAPGAAPGLLDPVWAEERAAGRHTLHLGAAIASRVARLHGGEVVATSPGEGLGTVLTMRLPVAPLPAEPG